MSTSPRATPASVHSTAFIQLLGAPTSIGDLVPAVEPTSPSRLPSGGVRKMPAAARNTQADPGSPAIDNPLGLQAEGQFSVAEPRERVSVPLSPISTLSPAAPLSPVTSTTTAAISSPATVISSVTALNNVEDGEPVRAQPQKRGGVQRVVTQKRKRAAPDAGDDFIVPDGAKEGLPNVAELEVPLPKRVKMVATEKAKKATKPKATKPKRKEGSTSALDSVQKAEERRFKKLQNSNKLAVAMSKQDRFRRLVVVKSTADQKRKLEHLKELTTALPPALSTSPGLDSELVDKKTRFDIQDMHRQKIEVTAGGTQARVETDPNDKEVRIIYLAKHTKKIPIFRNVYTELEKIIATPQAYPHVEVDMDAGDHGVLRIRWFKDGARDPNYKKLSRSALVRHKESTGRRPRNK